MRDVGFTRHALPVQGQAELSYVVWNAQLELRPRMPRAGILLLHGYGEHGAHMDPVARYLTAHDYLVVAPDARGHGCSGGRRGHISSFDRYVEDLEAVHALALARWPQVTDWSVVGHSMGGLIALRFALKNAQCTPQSPGHTLRGVAVSNPLLGLKVQVPAYKASIGQLLSSLWPTFSLGNELYPEDMSRDPIAVHIYRTDPLIIHKATARWFTEMLNATHKTLAELPTGLRIPTLFMLSTHDRVVDCNVSLRAYESIQTSHKALHLFEGMYHEIFAEIDHQRAWKILLQWLDAMAGARTGTNPQ